MQQGYGNGKLYEKKKQNKCKLLMENNINIRLLFDGINSNIQSHIQYFLSYTKIRIKNSEDKNWDDL